MIGCFVRILFRVAWRLVGRFVIPVALAFTSRPLEVANGVEKQDIPLLIHTCCD